MWQNGGFWCWLWDIPEPWAKEALSEASASIWLWKSGWLCLCKIFWFWKTSTWWHEWWSEPHFRMLKLCECVLGRFAWAGLTMSSAGSPHRYTPCWARDFWGGKKENPKRNWVLQARQATLPDFTTSHSILPALKHIGCLFCAITALVPSLQLFLEIWATVALCDFFLPSNEVPLSEQ